MEFNTVIIGSGVAGMTAAIYLKRAGINVCIIEKEVPGGQITRTSAIDNYPGFSSIDGPDLAMNMYNQVMALDVSYQFTEVVEIKTQNNHKIVVTPQGEIICENIIIATGRSPRKLNVPNEEKLIGRGISYCAICDGGLYKQKKVAVIGGGRAALEESLYLSKICDSVTLIHRRDGFRAEEELIDTVKKQDNIDILTNQTTEEFLEENGKLRAIKLRDSDNKEHELKVDGCFEYIGQIPNTKNFENLGIVGENGYVQVNSFYETDIKGIYAVGDCIAKDLYQIITACSEGAIAAHQITKL